MLRALSFGLGLMLLSACSLASPASRYAIAESSATLAHEQSEITGKIYMNVNANQASNGVGGGLRYRRGMIESGRLDLVVEADARGSFGGGGGEPGDVMANAYAGIKFAPIPHFALTTGLGGGAGTVGSFFAPEGGVIAGYENPYFVPFVSQRFVLSLPVTSDVRPTRGGIDYEGDPMPMQMQTSIGIHTNVGFKIPIRVPDTLEERFAISLGLGLHFEHMLVENVDSVVGLDAALAFGGRF